MIYFDCHSLVIGPIVLSSCGRCGRRSVRPLLFLFISMLLLFQQSLLAVVGLGSVQRSHAEQTPYPAVPQQEGS